MSSRRSHSDIASFSFRRVWRRYSVRNILVAIVVLVTMATPTTLVTGSPPNRMSYNTEDEPWLSDGSFYDVEYVDNMPQADGHPVTIDLCPPVPKVLPAGGCDLKECRSDRECAPLGLMCCYNGCIYTCLPQVRPAAYFDWLREPRRRLQFGSSWLIQGRDKDRDLILCSTTKPDDDSDPLLCPHGYECVIDDQGNPDKGVPNTGHCVPSEDASSEGNYNFENYMNKPQIDVRDMEELNHHCKIDDNLQLISGHTAVLNGKNCLCYEKKLICEE